MRALLPLALGVATALVAACSSSAAPTEADQVQTGPLFAQTLYRFHDDVDGLTCTKWGDAWHRLPPSAFAPTPADFAAALKADRNNNGYVCALEK